MSRPVVTVCVPVYNTAPDIKQCIESVFAQEFKDWVLLVSDNCSTDGTWEILQQLQHPQVRLFRHPEKQEAIANWNFLLEKVGTEFFCFLGVDDFFYPHHLARKLALLGEHPDAPFVHRPVDDIRADGEPFHGICIANTFNLT